MKTDLTKDESDFIEQMGLNSQEDGQSRILGRIWGLLMLREGPLDADQIADYLKISRASVSTNLRTLLGLKVLTRKAVPGERKDYFAINDRPYLALIEGQIEKLKAQVAMVEKAQKTLTGTHASASLSELQSFYEFMRDGYAAGVAKHKKSR